MAWSSLQLVLLSLLSFRGASAYGSPWESLDFRQLVAFGDSYTDESRLGFFSSHNGSAPPPGTLLPPNNNTSSGGFIWARYAVEYASNADKSVKLYDYAVSGAVCSNKLTPRLFAPINAPFPDVEGYEIPAFIADVNFRYSNNTPALDITPETTIYSMWIGTNDLGVGCFLDDSQTPGTTIVDYLDCVYNGIDKLNQAPVNGSFLVLMNIAPLQLVPMYQLMNVSGLDEGYLNATETHFRMEEQVDLVNEAYQWRTMGEVMVKKRYPGMNIAVYDVNSLLTDIFNDPTKFLNGTAPANVTGFVNHCSGPNNTVCVREASPDSFEFFDALHPSEQTDRIIAMEFINVISGNSTYASYFS